MKICNWSGLGDAERSRLLRRPAIRDDAALARRVAEIIGAVRRQGDAAIRQLTREIDGIDLGDFLVSDRELDEAAGALSASERDAIDKAAHNIARFHSEQVPHTVDIETTDGVRCERVNRPLRRVGLYVPAGSAPLPSTALMLGIPARIAGCREAIMCSPAQASGRVDAAVLYAASVAGIQRVFRLGGAQAIAAMAFGTVTVPKVDKLFGPGNAWVTAAKVQVSQCAEGAALDFPAGPSEVMVIADDGADPEFVATDLLSQAEHGADSQVLLIATNTSIADAVVREISVQKERLARRETVDAALQHSAVVVVDDLTIAIDIANEYAPEHLILQVRDPREHLSDIYAAGSVFLGPWAPESVGDYCSGTNHVLPTYGYARTYSSLGTADFMRAMTVQELSADGLRAIGPIAEALATLEGLDAHARAVTVRLERLGEEQA
jgi:histidinol dehydrogenase